NPDLLSPQTLLRRAVSVVAHYREPRILRKAFFEENHTFDAKRSDIELNAPFSIKNTRFWRLIKH
ncbi:hypothetical protein, partial [Aliagarivorans marinus]|uniref:hypothetical protein n=1 Tax=Aliagarivorans marinus TaxID=561965 RepID=UPI00047D8E99